MRAFAVEHRDGETWLAFEVIGGRRVLRAGGYIFKSKVRGRKIGCRSNFSTKPYASVHEYLAAHFGKITHFTEFTKRAA